MKRAYICKKEYDKTKWLELYSDKKKDFTELKKALKPFGWYEFGTASKSWQDIKHSLPDAFDGFDYDNGNTDDIPRYFQKDLTGPDGVEVIGGWNASENQKYTRQVKKALQNLGWEIWNWEKTYADMV